MNATGHIRKMKTTLEQPVKYELVLNEAKLLMNDFIGKTISFKFTGKINCKVCGRSTKKSFAQGFCYPCFQNAPENSPCIIRPELCEAHLGKGRDVAWEEKHHLQPHVVYLALSSGLKVGVTRGDQVPTRWIDQGAIQAIKLAETPNRHLAGIIEVAMKDHVADKTNWQRMLKNIIPEGIDLIAEKAKFSELLSSDLEQYLCKDDKVWDIEYPVNSYPEKVKSQSFDKTELIEGELHGIKGQYLMFTDGRVLNIRKHTSYEIEFNSSVSS